MSQIKLPYPQNIENRAKYNVFYLSDFSENNFGLIKPENDPGLTAEEIAALNYDFNQEQIDKLNTDAKNDQEGFKSGHYLPKGVFDPTSRDFDPNKETLVLDYVEDSSPGIFLEALDKYFKLDVPEVNAIKERFNIVVAWATSIEDNLKALKVIANKIGDLKNASILFLNDMNINEGSGPNHRRIGLDMNNRGCHITHIAQEVFNLVDNKIKSLFQTGNNSAWSYFDNEQISANTSLWKGYGETETDQLISKISDIFTQGSNVCVGKLSLATDLRGLEDATEASQIKSVHIPVQAFIDSIEKKS